MRAGEQIYKIYRFRETERRAGEKRKTHKIYKISLACEQENKYIGITEEELMAYTDNREDDGCPVGTPPDAEGYYTAPFTLDSLTTMAQFSARLDSLANL
ncbi:MAG: hypothetical protein IKJ81_06235 [Bacteroidales bacterium]|nr:hypothetical protein [Bacteroidales bacterium]